MQIGRVPYSDSLIAIDAKSNPKFWRPPMSMEMELKMKETRWVTTVSDSKLQIGGNQKISSKISLVKCNSFTFVYQRTHFIPRL